MEATTKIDESIYELRLTYAWNWFELHAHQRVSMFNFFILGIGVWGTVLANLYAKDLYVLALAASLVGMFICLIFLGIDCRNSTLIQMGEMALLTIENEWLFDGYEKKQEINPPHLNGSGILKWDACHYAPPRLSPGGKLKKHLTHGNLIPLFQWMMALCFFLSFVYAAINS